MSEAHILALDVGHKRIGVAIASHAARLPRPHGVIEAGTGAAKEIAKLIEAQSVETIVIGLPRGLDGQETNQTAFVRDFVKNLKEVVRTPIALQDEALTSHAAENELLARKVQYQKGDVDALAATIILEDYLNEAERTAHAA